MLQLTFQILICRNEAEKCLIETSINSLRISLKVSCCMLYLDRFLSYYSLILLMAGLRCNKNFIVHCLWVLITKQQRLVSPNAINFISSLINAALTVPQFTFWYRVLANELILILCIFHCPKFLYSLWSLLFPFWPLALKMQNLKDCCMDNFTTYLNFLSCHHIIFLFIGKAGGWTWKHTN